MELVKNKKSERTTDFKTILGPTFRGALPDLDDWISFKEKIRDEKCLALAELWYSKACLRNDVPFRGDFAFEELVNYGQNIFLAKLTDDGRWLTTYCGGDIVEKSGFDATGKYLDEFSAPETLKFWTNNFKSFTGEGSVMLEYFTLEYFGKEYTHCTTLSFPLKSDGSDEIDISFSYDMFTVESLYPD